MKGLTIASLLLVLSLAAPAWPASPVGGFYVHLNQQPSTGFGDSRSSVTFYDADDIYSGSASPLFSVHIPGELLNPGGLFGLVGPPEYNSEELEAIAVDPQRGDVYIAAFDSVGAGEQVGEVVTGLAQPDDTVGDIDIYRIDFQRVYAHWSSNFQGTTVTPLVTPGVGGNPPTIPTGAPSGGFDDYITYSSIEQSGSFLDFDPINFPHSNTFTLPGSVQKIAEVKRNAGQGFFNYSLEFVDRDTLLLLDDSSAPDSAASPATDHAYRLIERVSSSRGLANDTTADHLDGGYNTSTSQSWNSRVIGRVNQDFSGGSPVGHSEPESIAYHQDPATGVRGFWVTESDSFGSSRGDDIAFWDLDLGGYREHAVGGGPNFPTAFALDDDPLLDSFSNDGQADHIFVDEDTGDLIIIESGFGDDNVLTIGAEHEPAVIRREVLAYDDGAGRIQFGSWSAKQITTPVKDLPGQVGLERGHWAAYDSVNDRVIFQNPGTIDGTTLLESDLMVLDVNTGITTTLNDVDDSVALFLNDNFGDVADFFFIDPPTGVLQGDYNGDGFVNSADYAVWRDALVAGSPLPANETASPGVTDQADYDAWVANFGADRFSATGTSNSNAVPEPASATLLFLAWLATRRR